MSDISKKKSQFVKIYSRQSKSLWDDHSTMLWLATVSGSNDTELNLGFDDTYTCIGNYVDASAA